MQPEEYNLKFKYRGSDERAIINVKETSLDRVSGKRLAWLYEVTYAGEKRTFEVNSPGLPVVVLPFDELTRKLSSIERQPFR